MSLKQKTISGIFWSTLQKVGSRGITFLVTIVLARILTPKDFGLIGMLMVFIGLSQVVVGAGFSQALIQKKDPDEEDYSSVFYFNLAVSILMYGVLYFCAPLIAAFYHQPILIDLTRVLCIVFVVNAFSYVQEAKLTKEMRFKTLAIIHVPSSLIGGGVSIVMAKMGYGVWSIVALQVVQRIAYAIQIWIHSKWQPLLSFNRVKAKKLFSFGSKLMLSGMLDSVFQNIYLILIGRFFPVAQVGYYQNSNNIVKQPSQVFSSSLSSVTFSAFSVVQDDNKKLKQGYKKVVQQVLFWLTPLFCIAGVLATPLFRFVFSEKWLPAVPYFQILCVVGIVFPLNFFNLNVISVKGRSDLFLKLEIIKKIIVIVGITCTLPFGLTSVVIFQAGNSVFTYALNCYFSGRFINYGIWEQLKDVLPIFILSMLIAAGILALDQTIFNNYNDWIRLSAGFLLGGLSYVVLSFLIKLDAYLDLKHIFHSKFKKPKIIS